jgi:putative aminopeptidase FrvX
MDETVKLLKELTEASGVSGYEDEIRKIIRRYLQPLGKLSQDNLGSLICKKKGSTDIPRVVIAGHMDEIGFMVKYITQDGFIKFTPLGGWWDQVLLAQRVVINTYRGNVTGIIGAKPPHLLSDEDRKKIVEKKDMYIDIGATTQQEVEEAGIRIGDPIIPVSQFTVLANSKTYLAKAFDDRLGCAVMIAAMQKLAQKNHPNTVFGIATAQEEVGSRGANTSVDIINPNVAIVTEVEIAGDVPGIKPEESHVKMGGGPVLLVYDVRMIPNLKLRNMVIEMAKKNNIPLQLSSVEGGSTDGGPIHLHKSGVPTVVLSVPTRHIHSHNAIFHRDDFERTVDLLALLVMELNRQVVSGLTK